MKRCQVLPLFDFPPLHFFQNLFFKSLGTHALIFPIIKIITRPSFTVCVFLDKCYIRSYILFLKHHILCQYEILTDITGVSNINQKDEPYFVVYELLSLRFNNRLRVYVKAISQCVSSISDIYFSANWGECELWDMYGIYIENHEKLTRLLTDYGFEGHPLKKDFPLSGYYDVRYNEFKKRVIVDKLELGQEYRVFDYKVSFDNRLFQKLI
jgi:NADH:ubiquinone oxidoreductase subunit C